MHNTNVSLYRLIPDSISMSIYKFSLEDISGQSYKGSTIVNYDSRVVLTTNLPIL